MTLQFGAPLTYDTSSINYNRNMFIIQATELFFTGKLSAILVSIIMLWAVLMSVTQLGAVLLSSECH